MIITNPSHAVQSYYAVKTGIYHPVYDYNTGADVYSDQGQTVFTKVSDYVFSPRFVLSGSGSVAPLVVSPVALMTFNTKSGLVLYALGTLTNYYAGTLTWNEPASIVSHVSKIIYCDATNDNSVFGAGAFAAVASGTIYISTDATGANFNNISCPISPIDIAYANGILVAVDQESAWFTVDGQNWAQLNPTIPPSRIIASIL